MPMNESHWLDEGFEQHRTRLRAVAYRMLGSMDEADDALQEAWLRLRGRDPQDVENLGAWLTTVVGRVCLNMLRARRARREVPLQTSVPDMVVALDESGDPAEEAVLADAVGPALLMALDALSPAERFAFVLHDVFGVRFAQIAAALDRSEAAAQQLASRGRRRIRRAQPPERDVERQRRVVDAFFAASRDGNFEALLEILHPEVRLRVDGGVLRAEASCVLHGAEAVSRHTRTYAGLFPFVRPAMVNGAPGAVVVRHGQWFSVMAFTVTAGRIVAIDALLDPERTARLQQERGADAG